MFIVLGDNFVLLVGTKSLVVSYKLVSVKLREVFQNTDLKKLVAMVCILLIDKTLNYHP